MHLSKLLLAAQVCLAQSLLSLGNPDVRVDRLVSQRHQLQARDVGFTNEGNNRGSGHGKSGGWKDPRNFEISFYHINDVHA